MTQPTSCPGRSAQGQDDFVIAALGGMRNGFFVDSGASDGVSGSNTYRLEREFGWRGICVEPNDELFARLKGNRAATCVNCCLYESEGEVDFLEAAGVYGGIVGEYDPSLLRFVKEQFRAELPVAADGSVRPVRKPARRIGDVLGEHQAPSTIDYWSLDTEGSELAVLRGFPFEEYRVRAITVEHNRSPLRGRIRAYLESRGYVCVRDLGIDDCYLFGGPVSSSAWRSAAWSRPRRGRP